MAQVVLQEHPSSARQPEQARVSEQEPEIASTHSPSWAASVPDHAAFAAHLLHASPHPAWKAEPLAQAGLSSAPAHSESWRLRQP